MRGRVFGEAAKRREESSALTKSLSSVFAFVRFAEFEIVFFLFFAVAFLLFKDLTSRPDYNQILVKRPGREFWPF